MDRPLAKPALRIPPLPASLGLACMAVGAVVLIGLTTLALVPLLLGLGLLAAWLVAALLLGWAGVEGLAALERWMESDQRFQR
ncbi:MAG: glypican [Cyanobium sp. CZS 25K]|nr:glypican [Cyanobium sp. CZS25K]